MKKSQLKQIIKSTIKQTYSKSDADTLPNDAYANFDLLYDIKTYGDIKYALKNKQF